jgi:3-phenylpropionate/cinnamic acid dioxygenase small subunit
MTTDSSALGRLVAESAIQHTLAAYCQSCDDGRFADFGRCFADDATVTMSGQEIRGRAEIERWITAAMPPKLRGKHVTINTLMNIDGDRATAVSDYLFLAPGENGPTISVAGRYHDELAPNGEQWLFARRAISFLGGD